MSQVLVTGGSSGIGAGIVERLVADQYTVTAVARRHDRLAQLAERTGCKIRVADVTDLRAMRRLIDTIRPTILVNNAGVGMGFFGLEGISEDQIDKAIATNVIAPIQTTRAALSHMRRAGCGHIVNIGSIAGLHTMVSSVYGAGKSALHRFSQNLRQELIGSGIRVTEICPGRVASEFYESDTGNIEAHSGVEVNVPVLRPEDVAEAVSFALRAPPHVNISTIELLPVGQAVGGFRFADG